MSDYLDEIHANAKVIRDICSILQHYSEAFYTTGNEVMSDKLGNMANSLYDAQESIRNAVSIEINRSLKVSQEGAANLLKAVLGGAVEEKNHD